jgi:hypothetical protein
LLTESDENQITTFASSARTGRLMLPTPIITRIMTISILRIFLRVRNILFFSSYFANSPDDLLPDHQVIIYRITG